MLYLETLLIISMLLLITIILYRLLIDSSIENQDGQDNVAGLVKISADPGFKVLYNTSVTLKASAPGVFPEPRYWICKHTHESHILLLLIKLIFIIILQIDPHPFIL